MLKTSEIVHTTPKLAMQMNGPNVSNIIGNIDPSTNDKIQNIEFAIAIDVCRI